MQIPRWMFAVLVLIAVYAFGRPLYEYGVESGGSAGKTADIVSDTKAPTAPAFQEITIPPPPEPLSPVKEEAPAEAGTPEGADVMSIMGLQPVTLH